MTSRRDTQSLVAAGVLGAVAGAAVATWIAVRRQGEDSDQRLTARSMPSSERDGGAEALPAHIMDEVWSRNASFFGDEGFGIIRGSFVVVVGLGGVGSHAAHMLARSGVGCLRVIDFDQVTCICTGKEAS